MYKITGSIKGGHSITANVKTEEKLNPNLSVGIVQSSTVIIVNDVINGGIDKALSAEQGKILNTKKASKEEVKIINDKLEKHIQNHPEGGGGNSLTPEQEESISKIEPLEAEVKKIEGIKTRVSELEDNQGNLTTLETSEKGTLVGAINQVFQSVSNGKDLIATAITGKGINANSSDSFPVLADKISRITGGEEPQQTLELLYNFDNKIPGMAKGTIVLKSTDISNDGDYRIQWADNGGAFVEYEDITKFSMIGEAAIKTYEFIDSNVIPVNAIKVIAVKEDIIKASFIIPNTKRLTETKKYSFGLLSDVHADGDGDDLADTVGDLTRAFTYFNNKEGVKMNIITGDVTRDGRSEDIAEYKRIRDTYSSNTPVYLCRGNHDTLNGLSIEKWETEMDSNGLYYEKIIDGDIYLSLGMVAEDMASPFSDYELDWLEERMEEHKNKRVFLLEHVFVEPVGNVANLYPYDSLSNTIGTAGRRFRDIVSKYRNVIHFSGHSHLDFSLQRLNEFANVSKRTDILCHRVHTPSGATPRNNLVSTPDDLSNTFSDIAGSQGYVVDVYESCIVLRGRDFTKGKFLPMAQYIIDTTPIKMIDPGPTYPHIVDFTNFTSGSLGSDGSIRPSNSSQVSDLIQLNDNNEKSFIFPKGVSYIRIAYYDSMDKFINIDENIFDNVGTNTADGEVIALTQPSIATQLRIKAQGPINAVMFDGALLKI